ncbi:MAG: hypothetical protein H7X84_03825 [Verrucomicrobia bacterium]|nr:hypothetical protein [Prolixibacteraceae bacterium]
MPRAYGSCVPRHRDNARSKCRAVGSVDFVARDFNPGDIINGSPLISTPGKKRYY